MRLDGGPFFLIPRPQLTLHFTAYGADGAGRYDCLRGTTNPHQDIDFGAWGRGHHRAGDVAVHDEPDARPCLANLLGEGLMSWAAEHADGQVLDISAQRASDILQVRCHGGIYIDRVCRFGPNGDLVHIGNIWRLEHGPALGDGNRRDRIRHSLREQSRPINWVDRYVRLRFIGATQVLSFEQHRGFVLGPFADDDD